VTFTNAPSAQDQVQCLQAVAYPNAMFNAAIRGEFLLERFELFAENVPSRSHEAGIGFVEPGLSSSYSPAKSRKGTEAVAAAWATEEAGLDGTAVLGGAEVIC
jgi:hypothetical protein